MPYNQPYDIYDNNQTSGEEIYSTTDTLDTSATKQSPEVLAERAAKANFAMRGYTPGYQTLLDDFNAGAEPQIRQQIASRENNNYEEARLKLLKNAALAISNSTVPNSPALMQYLMENTQKQEVDPNYVLESTFAKQWMNDIVFGNKDQNEVFKKAFDKSAEEFTQMHNTSKDLLTRHQVFLKLNEDLKADYENLPGIDYPNKNSKFYAFVRNFSDVVNWYDLKNVIAPTNTYTPGGMVQEQARKAWLTPMVDISSIVDRIKELYKTNPHAAIELSDAMLRYSSDDAFVKNALVGLNIGTSATLGGVGKVAGGISRRLEKGFAGIAARGVEEAPTKAVQKSSEVGGIKLLTDQRTKPTGLLQDLRPGSEAYTKQGELFPTDSSIYTRQGELDLQPPVGREYTPVRDLKTGNVRYETYGEGDNKYQLTHTRLKPALPRDEKGHFISYPKEQLVLDVNAPQTPTQIEAPLVGGKGTKPVNVAADKVSPSDIITKDNYLAASAAFRKGPREYLEAINAYSDAIQAASVNRIDPQRALSKVGDTYTAAGFGAAKEIYAKLKQIDPEGILQPLIENAPHTFNPNIYAKAVDSASGVAASRLAAKSINRIIEHLGLLTDSTRIARLTEESLQQAIDTTRAFDMKYFRDSNHALSNAYMTFSVVRPEENKLTNTGLVKYWFGKPDATAFSSAEEATTTAIKGYKLPEGGFTVRQDGAGYHIVITKPIRETSDEVRDHLIETTASKTPNNWSNFLFRGIKRADAVLSLHDVRARKVASTAPNRLRAFEQEALQQINKLGKDGKKELQKVMEADRVYDDPVTGKIGTYQRTIQDFDKQFLELNGKLPTAEQRDAYNLTVQLNDMDYVRRGLEWLQALHRQGAELVRFSIPTPDGKSNPTSWFMGRTVSDINWTDKGDAVILWLDGAEGSSKTFHKLDKADDIIIQRNIMRKKISEGELQVIEVGNPRSKPISKETGVDAPINYVVTNTSETKPLTITDIAEYRPGGHIVYANKYYLKQPSVLRGYKGRLYYYGDKTIMGADTLKEAQDLEKAWQTAQNLMKEGKDTELSNFLSRNLPDMDIKKFKQFYTEAGPGGGLTAESPVKWVESNKDVFDVHPDLKDNFGEEVKNQLATPDMMRYLDKRFIAERGQILNTARAVGTESNPMFSISSAELINPYVAMSRAMGNSIKGRWMGDYKTLAAEHWIETFSDALNVPKSELRNNPLYYLSRQENYNYNADRKLLAAAKESQQRILNFIGHPNDLQRDVSYVEQRILDTVGNLGGKEWQDYAKYGIMEKIKDPFTHMRAFAFHLNIGMFNPVSYMVQLNTLTNILSISPKHAFQSGAAAFLNRGMLRTEDPKIWEHYAKVASKMGWDKEQFLESFEALKRTGWHNVGGEVAWKDSITELTPFKSKWGTFLDKGTMFFNEGEKAVRLTAWNTAYREWKAANPLKKLTAIDEANILNRADDLGVNMTRASNARWNEGVLSIPTQYFSYQARLMEQIWEGMFQTGGKRLSRAEAGRLLAGTALFYGIPVGLGAMTGFHPWYDDIKKVAIERDWPIHDNWFKIANDGLGAFILGLITGQDFNVAQRYGPGGMEIPLVSKILGTDKNKQWYDVLGASPSTIASVINTALPILKATYSATLGDGTFPLTMQDFEDGAKQIRGANNIIKTMYMLNTHNYVTKNQTVVDAVSNLDAIAIGLFGLTPRSITDTFLGLENEKDIKEGKEFYQKEAIKEIRNAWKAYSNGEDTLGDKYMKRASTYTEGGGLTWQERSEVTKRAISNNESLYELAERLRQRRLMSTPTQE